jgi:hypothetical protein
MGNLLICYLADLLTHAYYIQLITIAHYEKSMFQLTWFWKQDSNIKKTNRASASWWFFIASISLLKRTTCIQLTTTAHIYLKIGSFSYHGSTNNILAWFSNNLEKNLHHREASSSCYYMAWLSYQLKKLKWLSLMPQGITEPQVTEI